MKTLQAIFFSLCLGFLLGFVCPKVIMDIFLTYGGPTDFWFYDAMISKDFAHMGERSTFVKSHNSFVRTMYTHFWLPYYLFLSAGVIPLPLMIFFIPPFIFFIPFFLTPSYAFFLTFSFSLSFIFFLIWLLTNFSREAFKS